MDCVQQRPATIDVMAVAAMVPFCTYSDVKRLDAGERRPELKIGFRDRSPVSGGAG